MQLAPVQAKRLFWQPVGNRPGYKESMRSTCTFILRLSIETGRAGEKNNLRGSLQDISQGENYSFKDEQTLLALLHSLVQEGASQGEVEKRAQSS